MSASSISTSTPLTEWTCTTCRASDDVEIELQELDGAMVCPRCATVDAVATSATAHVDVNEVTGQIIHEVDTHRDLVTARLIEGDKRERKFTRHVDAMIKTNLSQIFGRCNYNLENGARLWFNKVREVDMKDRGLSQLTTLTATRRLPYLVALATRMAVQESILIPIYNRLKDKRLETAGAVRNYTKGDDRAFTMTLNDLLAKSQEVLSANDPARLNSLDVLQSTDKHLSRELGSALSARDELLCTVNRAIVIVQELATADPETRRTMLKCDQTKAGWPADPLDRLRRIHDWDQVLIIANGLYQAQACVALFPPTATYRIPAVAAIVLVTMAIQIVIGETLKNYPQIESELTAQLACYRPNVARRHNELERLIVVWATSIPEAGLPIPQLKMPKRTPTMGNGLVGWSSDKRRPIPFSAIVPKAGRSIAENWQAIKRTRLNRPAVIPFDEELALSRKMFGGANITNELQESLRRHTVIEDVPSRSASPAKSDVFSERSLGDRSESHLTEIGPDELASQSTPRPLVKSKRDERVDEVREWIEKGDDSSDDEASGSTDDEDLRSQSKRPRLSDTRQEVGQLPRPFAFSIGPTGFDIDRSDWTAGPSCGDPAKRIGPTISATSNVPRGQSVESGPSDGLTLASESCQMVRQPSATPSSASSSNSSSLQPITPRSLSGATPLSSRASPAPSSLIKASAVSRAVQLRAVQRGLLDESDHVGVLIRERSELASPDTRVLKPKAEPRKDVDTSVVIAINHWLDQQKERGTIPKWPDPAELERLGLPGGRLPSNLSPYLASQGGNRSTLETLLRVGVSPSAIPIHLLPQSICAVNLDLYHYRQRDAILGIGGATDTPEMAETLLRLFFRGHGNDTLLGTFLKDEEVPQRIQGYKINGHWDVLDDSSPVARPKRRKPPGPKPEPDNMIQRIAHEYEHDADVSAGNAEAETEMIQKAVVAGLIRVQQKPRWDPHKLTATVPKLWYNDDLSILRLVQQTDISFADASALTDTIWDHWDEQERAGYIDMPPLTGAGARLLVDRGCAVINGVVAKL